MEIAKAMLVLSGQGSREIVTRLAVAYAPAENFKERRGCAINDHLEDDTDGCRSLAR